MKKLTLLMCSISALIVVNACAQTHKPEIEISQITLNGFSQDSAISMVKRFNRTNIRKPIMTNVWFSKEMLQNVVSLLGKEKGPKGESVDGIRIYYATNPAGQNTVLLVSTYKAGTDPKTKKTIHQDYFTHNINDALFTISPGSYQINGDICTDNSCGNGARLYEICKICNEDSNCDPTKPHYISMQYAQEMVWNFGNGLINTQNEWFDLDMLSEMAKSKRFNGIRIYFGKRSNLDPIYPGLDGFVIVTTEERIIDGKKIARRDYLDCNETKHYFEELLLSNKLPPAKTDSGQDRGEQCQPNCQGSSLSDVGQ